MIQCKPCGKIFSGPCTYDQHLASIKHKKKVSQVNFFNCHDVSSIDSCIKASATDSRHEIQSSTCGIAFDTVEELKKHAESPQRALKVMEKAEGKVSDNVVSTSTESTENYKSKRTTESNSVQEEEFLLPSFNFRKIFYEECVTCGKAFSGLEPYKQHIQSNEHQRKIAIQSSYTSLKISDLSCNICKKFFSGQAPYMQHMDSETHKKKKQQFEFMQRLSLKKEESDTGREETEIENSETNLNMSFLSCDICKKHFSGQAPYMQHMESETHKKKKQQFEIMQSLSSEKEESDTGKEGIEMTNQWFCKICNKQCSGLIPYQQHIQGTAHVKNLKRAELVNACFKNEETTNYNKQENGSENITLRKSRLVQGKCPEKSAQKMEEDNILPVISSRLETMSADKLKQLLSVVIPDQNAEFDKLEKNASSDVIEDKCAVQGNSVSNQERSDEPDDENLVNIVPGKKTDTEEGKEKPVVQVCELCDGTLYDN